MAKRKKKKSKPLTRNEKIGYTLLCIFLMPIIVLIFLWCQSSLLHSIFLSGVNQAAKNLHIPIDKDCIPYSKDCDSKTSNANAKAKKDSKINNTSAFDLIDSLPKEHSKSQKGGKMKKQKGGALRSKFNKDYNDALSFFDTEKYGFPYDLKENENALFQDFANYFINIFSTPRSILVKVLETVKESLYTNESSDPPEGIMDFFKFTVLLPILNILFIVGQPIVSTGTLLWSAISDQGLIGMIIFSIVAVCSIMAVITYGIAIFAGGIASIFASPYFIFLSIIFALFQGFAWPYGVMGVYLNAFLYKPTWDRFKLFKSYGRKYKMFWALVVILLWFVSISAIWDFDKMAMLASGGVPFAMWLLTAIGLASTF